MGIALHEFGDHFVIVAPTFFPAGKIARHFPHMGIAAPYTMPNFYSRPDLRPWRPKRRASESPPRRPPDRPLRPARGAKKLSQLLISVARIGREDATKPTPGLTFRFSHTCHHP